MIAALRNPARKIVGSYLGVVALLAVAYFVTGKLGALLALPPGFATPIWPPSGIALAMLLIFGTRHFPGVLLGSFATNLALGLGNGASFDPVLVAIAISIAAGATLQAVASAWMLRRLGAFPGRLEETAHVLIVLAIGGVVGCAINATIGTLTLSVAGINRFDAIVGHWITWWTGDVIGVLLFTPILLLFSQSGVRAARKTAVTIAMIGALGVATVTFLMASRLEKTKYTHELTVLNDVLNASLSTQIEAYQTILMSIDSFFSSSDHVSFSEFKSFTDPFLNAHPEITALSWNKRVNAAERNAFEVEMRSLGFDQFQITERISVDGILPAQSRPIYFPVTYVNPFGPNRAAHGFDTYGVDGVSGTSARRTVLDQGRDADAVQSTGRISVVQRADQNGVILYHPIFENPASPESLEARRDGLTGYAAGVLVIPGLMQEVAAAGEERGVDIVLNDSSAKESVRLFDSRWPGGVEPQDWTPPDDSKMARSERTIEIAGRTWSLAVIERSETAIARASWNLWYVMIGGMTLIGLTGASMIILTAQTDIVLRLVGIRTLALGNERSRMRSIIETSADAILAVDDEGEVVSCNAAGEALFDRPADLVVGRSIRDLIFGLEGENDLASLSDPASSRHAALLTFLALRPDGSRVDVEISPGAFYSDERRYVSLIVRDVSERSRVEKERQVLFENLQRTNEELERFAYVASHDLQEPLRKIAIFSDILEQNYSQSMDAKGARFLSVISSAAVRMKTLIQDLLAYSKSSAENLSVQRIDMTALLGETREFLVAAIEESGAEISCEGAGSVLADPFLMGRLVQNLVSNSLKYRSDAQPKITISVMEEPDFFQISVRDNGQGFDPANAEKIFRVFERLHRKDEVAGTGIGLAVCERIARRHGGRIWAESEIGEGSTFTVQWPKLTREPEWSPVRTEITEDA